MPDSPTPAPRRPIGRAIRRNDASRTRASQVGPADVLASRMDWMRFAPRDWEGLIEAKVDSKEAR